MSAASEAARSRTPLHLAAGRGANANPRHRLGVVCGLGAGVWLGAAEAPTKLVNSGLSPFAVSLCMVLGVFTARWTFPTLLKGTSYVFRDLRRKPHLLPWAVLAGCLWAVANTLTVFAVRDVGLAVAFPLWNANLLFGLLWGRLLFGELRGAPASTIARVTGGAAAIVAAAILLGLSTGHHAAGAAPSHAMHGIAAALGASLLWGTMYVPYRKAYISGMNPLSFVTVFTVGEVGAMLALVFALDGGLRSPVFHSPAVRPLLFWLFLGGFVWVVGDLLQQFATKYLGIGRGIPLSNTNQLWGLLWAALVFGELHGATPEQWTRVVLGSLVMIVGALLIGSAAAGAREQTSTQEALARECDRYGMDYGEVLREFAGEPPAPGRGPGALPGTGTQPVRRRWWDVAIALTAAAVFVALAAVAAPPAIPVNRFWVGALALVLVGSVAVCGRLLRRETDFS